MATSQRPTILAVDDEPAILESFRLILEDDYSVLTAPDGAAALEILQNHHVHLVLLDIGLPDTSGLALLERIRARDAHVPVILVTIIDRARTALDAIRLGATDFVTKPFDEADLCLRIRRALTEPESVEYPLLGVRPLARRILLIDADVGTRAALTVGLSHECRIQAVPTLGLALGELAESMPDLVIVRLQSVGADPARCLDALRSRYPNGPLILIASWEVVSQAPGDGGPTVIVGEPMDFTILLAEVAALLPPTPALPAVWPISARSARVLARVARAYATVTVAALSEDAGISEAHLSRSFHAEFGQALKTFIVRVRIEAAKCLLGETQAKANEIANRVGLYDGPHLSRMFSRYRVGRPSSFRQHRAAH
jgi:DNA-binding response OmpR family regulator